MKAQPLILVLAKSACSQSEMLAGLPHVFVDSVSGLSGSALNAEVVLNWSGAPDLLRAAILSSRKIRWIHSCSVGLDKILFPELIASTVPLTNGSGVFSPSLGEFAIAAILYFAKDLGRMLRNQAVCRWEQFDMEEIAGQTVGIVGYGDIGRAVALRVYAMGMRILALKRHAPAAPDPLVSGYFAPNQLHSMLAQSDYVVVATPLTLETRHMISHEAFAAMKSTAVVINIGRGAVIDQQALIRVLAERRIRGAGLDVFEQEPIPPADPIYKLDNVLISPHCADHTTDYLDRAMRFFLQQYERFSSGQPLENIVEKHLGY
jgi:phosphoglycerate dehydrogenase-like enzyme